MKTNPAEHWHNLPEFIMDKVEPYAMINIRVASEEDLKDLEERLGQKLTKKTKAIWHPFKSHYREEIYVWE